MNKMLEKHKKAMKNGGFTLVELIIVIAILAVLVAIVAPQYFQYVERSRKAVDVQAAAEILQAAKVAAIDPDNKVDGGFTVTWDTAVTGTTAATGSVTVSGTADSKLQNAIQAVVGATIAPKSAFAKTADMTINVTYDASTGFSFTVVGTATDTSTWLGSMQG